MDHLFTPWRYAYISGEARTPGCLFCTAATAGDDVRNLIVHRGERCFVMLNAFPFTSGHVMIVPFQHVGELHRLEAAAAAEVIATAQRVERILREVYRPDGLNLGMNLGKAAGAGVADHLHLHLLPRWFGDTNFMGAMAETRTLPEDLQTTYQKLRGKL